MWLKASVPPTYPSRPGTLMRGNTKSATILTCRAGSQRGIDDLCELTIGSDHSSLQLSGRDRPTGAGVEVACDYCKTPQLLWMRSGYQDFRKALTSRDTDQ